jgi:uncharacterized OsmC-like protein
MKKNNIAMSEIIYAGDLRVVSKHVKSGQEVHSDAPVDNHGKGEAFSPTDIMATSLAKCMLTVMGIRAEKMGIDMSGSTAKVYKVMASEPRRISQIRIEVLMSASFSEKKRKILEMTGRQCPVALSLHPDLKQEITFIWPD